MSSPLDHFGGLFPPSSHFRLGIPGPGRLRAFDIQDLLPSLRSAVTFRPPSPLPPRLALRLSQPAIFTHSLKPTTSGVVRRRRWGSLSPTLKKIHCRNLLLLQDLPRKWVAEMFKVDSIPATYRFFSWYNLLALNSFVQYLP